MSSTILCELCLTPGVESTHKGDRTVECEDCGRVLYREVGAV